MIDHSSKLKIVDISRASNYLKVELNVCIIKKETFKNLLHNKTKTNTPQGKDK